MKKELREQIIGLIDSKDMREHLLSMQDDDWRDYLDNDWWDYDDWQDEWDNRLLAIIGSAPVPLERKQELLQAFIDDAGTKGKPLEKAQNALKELQCAWERLHNLQEKDVLTLEAKQIRPIGGLKVNLLGIANAEHAWVYSSFDAAKKYIKQVDFWNWADQMDYFGMTYGEEREQHPEKDWEAMEKEWVEPANWYWELFLHEFGKRGDKWDEDAHKKYRFILTPKGEALYVVGTLGLKLLSGGIDNSPLTLPLPWKPGDILRIDCSPYAPVNRYCLVLDAEYKTNCLYPAVSNRVGIGTVEKDYYYESLNDCWQCLPGLLRAERYEDELPENCKWMLPLQEKLRKDPKLGDKLRDKIKPSGGLHDIIAVGGECGECNYRCRYNEKEWQVSVKKLFSLAGIPLSC